MEVMVRFTVVAAFPDGTVSLRTTGKPGEYENYWVRLDADLCEPISSKEITMETPKSAIPHEPDYTKDAWQAYTPHELGEWIHLLLKRSKHRATAAKRDKDIDDAQVYFDMLGCHIVDARKGD